MDQPLPTHLKLHTEEPAETAAPRLDDLDAVAQLCLSFEHATGWPLQYASIAPDEFPPDAVWSCEIAREEYPVGGSLSLMAGDMSAGSLDRRSELDDIKPLAAAVGGLLGELHRTRQAAWRQAADLATAIPVAGHPNEQEHLARRLQSVLKGGAEAVGCQAAALYLLDEATTELTLRAAWGLPPDRLPGESRLLRGAVADVEALAGHAIVLEDTSELPHWKCPEPSAAAVCVPVASPTMELGTLWMFSETVRDFSDEQTNLIEIIAGRLAVDLEREVLLREGTAARQADRQLETLARQQQDQLPQIAPLVEGWQVAGWTEQGGHLGGSFHDWCVLRDGRLAVAVGQADGEPLPAAMTAATVGAAVKAHSNYRHDTGQMLQRVSETLWESGSGDRFASLFYAAMDPESSSVELAAAGPVAAFVLTREGCRQIDLTDPKLGTDADTHYPSVTQALSPGDVLVVITDGFLRGIKGPSRRRKLDALGKALSQHRRAPATEIIEAARQYARRHAADRAATDQTVLAVKRD